MRSPLKSIISVAGLALSSLLIQAAALAQFTVIHNFGSGSDGFGAGNNTLTRVGSTFYGTTYYGGTNGLGSVYAMDAFGNVNVLHSFSGPDGENGNSEGSLVYYGGWIYGTSGRGGANNTGVIFRLLPDPIPDRRH
ncbi:MAG TPA: choice-of-anchor tandem repeat GloVer-containing protein [Chthonomonadaceae bacterium]|nr:choice-of-anchor tandem repeat GloVer-containing protein [Chthonomonadaceae bacterium]